MKIVADDKIPFLRGVLEKVAEVVYLPGHLIKRDDLLDADALLTRTRTKCTEALLEGTRVRFIGTATIGHDHIDTHFCEKHGIYWTNAPGCNSGSVCQYVTASMLTFAHQHNIVLEGKTIGIIGVGNVGSKVARTAAALRMNVLLNDPPREKAEGKKDFVLLGEILYNADIITVHVPLKIVGEDSTWHLFNEKSFKKMKKGTWFINSSRGEIVDTPALKTALSNNKVKTILDVWENEPDIDQQVMNMSFISTPHIAGYSTDGKANGTSMIVKALCDFFELPLRNWYPSDVPSPLKPVINLDGTGKDDQEIIREAVIHSYNILNDDERLRLNPNQFENQRGFYPLRREFASYTVITKGCSNEVKTKLETLGFKIQQ